MKTALRLPLLILGSVIVGGALIELPHAKNITVHQVVAQMDVPEMTKNADLIIIGKVVERLGTIRDIGPAGEDMVYTRWSIQPQRGLKNSVAKSIVVRTLGGQYLSTIIDVEDQPDFTVGEHVTLFLRQIDGWKGEYRTVGEFQGKFRLENRNGKTIAIQSETKHEQDETALEQLIEQQ